MSLSHLDFLSGSVAIWQGVMLLNWEGLVWLDVLTVRVVKQWDMLPREAVDALLLETSDGKLDRALNNLM